MDRTTATDGSGTAAGEQTRTLRTVVNGRALEHRVPVRRTLADFLREDVGLTGTHLGCEHGVCGACTVLLDGRSVRSCLLLAVQAEGHAVTTVEGLAAAGELGPVQQAFWEHHGLQCGFCTPGMVVAATELLAVHPDPTEQQIREHMSGNICRCTGYHFIVDSILAAAQRLRAGEAG
jgi:carbon-monoxide dehydrogenase small subunit